MTRQRTPTTALAGYRRGDFFLSTPQRTVLASGPGDVLSGTDGTALADDVRTTLGRRPDTPLAVGVLPFHSGTGTPGRLVVPTRARVTATARPAGSSLTHHPIPAPVAVRAVPAPARHIDTVSDAIRALTERRLRKVVLARALDIELAEPLSVESVLHNLVRDNPGGYTFAAELPKGRTLVGSSPELLVSRTGGRVVSHPHAGSMPRSADPVTDERNAATLRASRKDHIEHAVLTEAVVETLRPYCRALTVPRRPDVVATPAVWHLRTTITGELLDRDATALHLAAALHPTPAVCGTPTESARALVTELEEFDRGYYAGTVGWMDAQGDGEWAVSIRCAEVAEHTLRLYAGGGIVPESDPESELEETSAKFTTLLTAMGLPGPPQE